MKPTIFNSKRKKNPRKTIDPTTIFSYKAEKYARYRWHYAPEAIQTIMDTAGLTSESSVADIGAGTGILTQAFTGKVNQIFAIEPNPEMRALAEKALAQYSNCQVIDGRSEATTLPDHAIDLITAAQAAHWFDPEATKKEFYRILKPGGWIALCWNSGMDETIGNALKEIFPAELSTDNLMLGKRQPKTYYFNGDNYTHQTFPFTSQITWETFLGSLSSASYAPVEGTPLYENFERKAKSIFDQFSSNGLIALRGETELYLGQIQAIKE